MVCLPYDGRNIPEENGGVWRRIILVKAVKLCVRGLSDWFNDGSDESGYHGLVENTISHAGY